MARISKRPPRKGDLSRDSFPGSSLPSSNGPQPPAQRDVQPRLSLAYEAPAWMYEVIGWPKGRAKRPPVHMRGNVAFLGTRPLGFRLIEGDHGWLLQRERRPLYPPLPMERAA